MTNYVIVSGADASALTTAVKAYLALGWVTTGGPTVVSTTWYQAVTQ